MTELHSAPLRLAPNKITWRRVGRGAITAVLILLAAAVFLSPALPWMGAWTQSVPPGASPAFAAILLTVSFVPMVQQSGRSFWYDLACALLALFLWCLGAFVLEAALFALTGTAAGFAILAAVAGPLVKGRARIAQ